MIDLAEIDSTGTQLGESESCPAQHRQPSVHDVIAQSNASNASNESRSQWTCTPDCLEDSQRVETRR